MRGASVQTAWIQLKKSAVLPLAYINAVPIPPTAIDIQVPSLSLALACRNTVSILWKMTSSSSHISSEDSQKRQEQRKFGSSSIAISSSNHDGTWSICRGAISSEKEECALYQAMRQP